MKTDAITETPENEAACLTSSHQPAPVLPIWGILTLMLVATLTIMVGSVIVPALPAVAQRTGMESNASWLVTLPALGVILFGPIAGSMIDRLGARTTLFAGLVLYGLLGGLGAWLVQPELMIADRVLLGGATIMVMASGTVLIADYFEGAQRLQMMANQGMAIELGGVIFLSIGGLLAESSPQWPFALYAFAWVCLLLGWKTLPALKHSQEHHAESLLSDEAAATPDTSTSATSKSATFHNSPSNTSLWKQTDVLLAAMLSMVVFFCALITLPLSMAEQGISESHIGFYLAGVSLVAVIAAGLMPKAVVRIGSKYTFSLACICYASAHVIYALGSGWSFWLPAALLMGTGFGFSIPLANHDMVERSPATQRGKNMAALSMAIFGGQFLSSFVLMLREWAGQDFSFSFALAAILALLAMAGVWILRPPANTPASALSAQPRSR